MADDAGAMDQTIRLPYRSRRHGLQVVRLEGYSGDDHISRVIRETGTFYEADLLRYLEAVLGGGEPGVVLDIGANIGNHAVFFAVFLASHVIAVEPNAAVVPVLTRNLRGNVSEPGRWSVVPAAVGAACGTGALELPAGAGNNVGMTRVRTQGGMAGAARVAVTTVDRIVAEFYARSPDAAPVRLMKIDVEGMEPSVLEGARATLREFAPDIVAEAQGAEEKAQLEGILRPLGYRVISRHSATPVYHWVHTGRWRARWRAVRHRASERLRRLTGRA